MGPPSEGPSDVTQSSSSEEEESCSPVQGLGVQRHEEEGGLRYPSNHASSLPPQHRGDSLSHSPPGCRSASTSAAPSIPTTTSMASTSSHAFRGLLPPTSLSPESTASAPRAASQHTHSDGAEYATARDEEENENDLRESTPEETFKANHFQEQKTSFLNLGGDHSISDGPQEYHREGQIRSPEEEENEERLRSLRRERAGHDAFLKGYSPGRDDSSTARIARLEEENAALRNEITELRSLFEQSVQAAGVAQEGMLSHALDLMYKDLQGNVSRGMQSMELLLLSRLSDSLPSAEQLKNDFDSLERSLSSRIAETVGPAVKSYVAEHVTPNIVSQLDVGVAKLEQIVSATVSEEFASRDDIVETTQRLVNEAEKRIETSFQTRIDAISERQTQIAATAVATAAALRPEGTSSSSSPPSDLERSFKAHTERSFNQNVTLWSQVKKLESSLNEMQQRMEKKKEITSHHPPGLQPGPPTPLGAPARLMETLKNIEAGRASQTGGSGSALTLGDLQRDIVPSEIDVMPKERWREEFQRPSSRGREREREKDRQGTPQTSPLSTLFSFGLSPATLAEGGEGCEGNTPRTTPPPGLDLGERNSGWWLEPGALSAEAP